MFIEIGAGFNNNLKQCNNSAQEQYTAVLD